MTVSRVNQWFNNGGSLSVSPVNVGDLMVLVATSRQSANLSATPSGGGVATWNSFGPAADCSGAPTSYDSLTAGWWGIVTATGAATITGMTNSDAVLCQEYSTSLGAGNWMVETDPHNSLYKNYFYVNSASSFPSGINGFDTGEADPVGNHGPALPQAASGDVIWVGCSQVSGGMTWTGGAQTNFGGVGQLSQYVDYINVNSPTVTDPTGTSTAQIFSSFSATLLFVQSGNKIVMLP